MNVPSGGHAPPHASRRRWAIAGLTLALVVVLAALVVLTGVAVDASRSRAAVGHADPNPVVTVEESYAATDDPVTTPSVPMSPTRPPVPAGPRPVAATAANPLMADLGMPDGGCVLPPWSKYEKGVKDFLRAGLNCLDARWRPIVAQLDLPWRPPALEVTLESKTTPCGGSRLDPYNSYYCSANDLITVVPESYLSTPEGIEFSAATAMAMLAHEYGHHLQYLSGIGHASRARETAAGEHSPEGLELSRRLELQAQCLAGIFYGATFGATAVEFAVRDAYRRGDGPGREPDHGQRENVGAWFEHGVTRNRLADCNTYTAESDAVG